LASWYTEKRGLTAAIVHTDCFIIVETKDFCKIPKANTSFFNILFPLHCLFLLFGKAEYV
jgi:hypothetical protein